MDWITVVGSVLGGLIIAGPGILALILGRRAGVADTATKYADLANRQADQNRSLVDCMEALRMGLRQQEEKVEILDDKVKFLEGKEKAAEAYIRELLAYIDYLIEIMKVQGIIPEKARPVRKES